MFKMTASLNYRTHSPEATALLAHSLHAAGHDGRCDIILSV